MTLLIATPTIMPPEPAIYETWDYGHHLIVDNSTDDETRERWHELSVEKAWRYRPCAGNEGVAAAWNYAFDIARTYGYERVALVSQSMRFTEGTGRFERDVHRHADERGLLTDQAFHAIVLTLAAYDTIGGFDPGFYPAYYEDSCALRRMFTAGIHTPAHRMNKVHVAAECVTGAAMAAGHCSAEDYARNGRRFVRKYGGPPFHETFRVPWDSDSTDLDFNWATAEKRWMWSEPESSRYARGDSQRLHLTKVDDA